MYKVIIFGGTTEGRRLYEFTQERRIAALTCVATEYGAEQLSGSGVRAGRLDKTQMAELISRERPALVVDATHPYATEVSLNIKAACAGTQIEYLRVSRESADTGIPVHTLDEVLQLLKSCEDTAFVTLGAKEARALTALPGFKERLWLRILPSPDGLRECLSLGFSAKRLICMQGPFSRALNMAMLRDTGARILVTKESGPEGGFAEKLSAAEELGMRVLIVGRPEDPGGVSLSEAIERIAKL